jgi:hypothetical protein
LINYYLPFRLCSTSCITSRWCSTNSGEPQGTRKINWQWLTIGLSIWRINVYRLTCLELFRIPDLGVTPGSVESQSLSVDFPCTLGFTWVCGASPGGNTGCGAHNYPIRHKHVQKLVWYKLIIISLDFSEKVYILTFEKHSGVCKYLTIYFQYVYSMKHCC